MIIVSMIMVYQRNLYMKFVYILNTGSMLGIMVSIIIVSIIIVSMSLYIMISIIKNVISN